MAHDLEIIPATSSRRWHAVLAEAEDFDAFHLPEYHLVAEEHGEGKGVLFAYREGARMVAWPFLLRPVLTVPGLEGFDLQDASSVYGYPGPVASPGVAHDAGFIQRFGAALHDAARDLGLISMFSRLNPFLNGLELTGGVGIVKNLGETVCIDLTASPDAQWSAYRANHQRDIREARQRGLSASRDPGWARLDDFVRLYTATMQRVDADRYYFFDGRYFLRLREALGDRLHLFVATLGDAVACAATAIHGGTTVHYHLSGSDPTLRGLATTKVVLDEMRRWSGTTGARYLNLGGGVGCERDSLFHFKAGFSPLRQPFRVWNHVVQPQAYQRLKQARHAWLAAHGLNAEESGFFPEYRTGHHAQRPSATEDEQQRATEVPERCPLAEVTG